MNMFAGLSLTPVEWLGIAVFCLVLGAVCAWLLIGGE